MRRVAVIALLLLIALPAAARDWDGVEFTSEPLADGLWRLSGAGGNVVLSAGADGVLLVDADYEQLADKLLAEVRALAGRDPDRVISTHWHFDHVGGNAALAAAGAELIAHANVRALMSQDRYIELLDNAVPASPPEALPVLTFTDSLSLWMNGGEILVYHPAPAHTDGDAVVVFRDADVIHTGDLVFNCGYPFIDTSHGGDIDGMIAAVETVIGLCTDATKVVPGHGPVTDRAGLETYLGILTGYRDAIAPLKAQGMSLDEVKAAKATADLDAQYGEAMFSPDLFTAMVYLTVN